jgi:hypothetical protein
MAPRNAKAAYVVDMFLTRALPARARYFNDDDRMCAHYLYDWMQAYQDFSVARSPLARGEQPGEDVAPKRYRKYFPKARMAVHIVPAYHAVVNLSKGGVVKATGATGPLYSDTGLIAKTATGDVLVSHIVDDYDVQADVESGVYTSAGSMCKRKTKLATPLTQIVFRLLNLTLGRFAPNLLRATLQKILITGKPRTGWRFKREIRFSENSISVHNVLERPAGAAELTSVHLASDATSIYVANSNVYQRSVLLPWRELTQLREQVNATGRGEETITIETGPAAQ